MLRQWHGAQWALPLCAVARVYHRAAHFPRALAQAEKATQVSAGRCGDAVGLLWRLASMPCYAAVVQQHPLYRRTTEKAGRHAPAAERESKKTSSSTTCPAGVEEEKEGAAGRRQEEGQPHGARLTSSEVRRSEHDIHTAHNDTNKMNSNNTADTPTPSITTDIIFTGTTTTTTTTNVNDNNSNSNDDDYLLRNDDDAHTLNRNAGKGSPSDLGEAGHESSVDEVAVRRWVWRVMRRSRRSAWPWPSGSEDGNRTSGAAAAVADGAATRSTGAPERAVRECDDSEEEDAEEENLGERVPNSGPLWLAVSRTDDPTNVTLLGYRDSLEVMLRKVRDRIDL